MIELIDNVYVFLFLVSIVATALIYLFITAKQLIVLGGKYARRKLRKSH